MKIVKINGYYANILAIVLLFILSGFIYVVKIKWMNKAFPMNNLSELLNNLRLFFLIFFGRLLINEFIKYVIYRIYGVRSIKFKIKQLVFFLYSPTELTILQARILWIMPFLFFIPFTIIAIIYFNFFVALAFSFILIATSDDLIMYLYLLKFNRNDIFIQEENVLGFEWIQRRNE